ncbi:unnamed protein product [Rotaria magnacalcarata]|uniref:Uncharacterized protein n=1 Tax=Rotaria magnacalcarata TaxID=392030 RepID=A0A820KSH2_9BILA|nr:unnamed protein product [Rotaria magnacalcarata]CAF4349432.1 unnamed protein product [Rotaria magnacalcarata]
MLIPQHEGITFVPTSNKPIDLSMEINMNKKAKKYLKFSKKSVQMEQEILLFDSVLFTLKTLYECRLLKNGAAVLRGICESLVNKQILIKVDRATGFRTKSVTIYIKVLPNPTSDIECHKFINDLASLGNPSLTMQTVLDTCRKIKYFCKKSPIQNVFKILDQPQYKCLNLDLSPLHSASVDKRHTKSAICNMNAGQNYSYNHDLDMPLNNHALNNDTNECAVQNDSPMSLTEDNGNRCEVDDQMLNISAHTAIGKFTSVSTNDSIKLTDSDALLYENDHNDEQSNQYQEVQMNIFSINFGTPIVPFTSERDENIQSEECHNPSERIDFLTR